MEQERRNQPKIYRVSIAYQAAYPGPWHMKAGDQLAAGHKESEWAGWLWCTDEQGQSRWVPERFLSRRGDVVIAQRAYNATELTVSVGEMVIGEERESDWVWCQNRAGQNGWVPLENLVHARYESEE